MESIASTAISDTSNDGAVDSILCRDREREKEMRETSNRWQRGREGAQRKKEDTEKDRRVEKPITITTVMCAVRSNTSKDDGGEAISREEIV